MQRSLKRCCEAGKGEEGRYYLNLYKKTIFFHADNVEFLFKHTIRDIE
jgi:hypothetical protein